MKTLYTTLLAVSATLIAMPSALALERTSSGNLQSEASWSALKTMVDTTNGRVTILQTAITACSKNGKLYAPSASNADAGGCIPMPAGITGVDLSQMKTFGPAFNAPGPHGINGNFSIPIWSSNAQNMTCPANTVMVGIVVHTSGTCEQRCNQDGPIIQSLNVKCAPLK